MAVARQKYHPSSSKTVVKNGWVIIFLIFCGIVYADAIHKKKQVVLSLDQQLNSLKIERELLKRGNQDLSLQINSQSDPAWIELVLKKGLGLVPEFQRKVYFCEGP